MLAILDAASIVARHHERLRHPQHRSQAVRDIAWEAGEVALGNAVRIGAGAGTVTVMQGSLVAGTAVAGSTAVTAGAPLAVGFAAAWAGSKAVRHTRHHLRSRASTLPTT